MTKEEATAHFQNMTLPDLRELARTNNIPDIGLCKEELIMALNGECPKCKGGKMTVIYEPHHQNKHIASPAPCKDCPK